MFPRGPGGLTSLLELIGHCEKELTIGTMQHCKEALVTAGIAFESWPKRVDHSDYFANSRPAVLAMALAQFLEMDSIENCFWKDFRERVNDAMQNEFRVTQTFNPQTRTFMTR